MIFIKSFGVWTVFVCFAILNGLFREKFLTPKFGEFTGHILSSITLSSLVLMLTFAYISTQTNPTNSVLLSIGGFWLLLTIAFEFSFGHYILKLEWKQLIENYNIFKGRLWVLVLLSTALAPLLCGQLLGINSEISP